MFNKYLFHLINNSIIQNQENRFSLLDRKKEAYFLDLGCDDGAVTVKMAQMIGTQNIHGIELVTERIKLAKKKGIRVKKADLNKPFPYKDNSIDIIHSNQVIEHLVDTDNFISEIYRILKKNGSAIISTENISSWHNIFALLFGFQPFSMTNFSRKGNIGNPFALWKDKESENSKLASWQHMRLFSYFGLKDIFRKHGFVIEKIMTAGYYPFWGALTNIDPIHGHWITIKVRKI